MNKPVPSHIPTISARETPGRDFDINPLGDVVHVRRRRQKSSVILLQASEEQLSQRTGFIVLAVGPDVKKVKPGDYVLCWPGKPVVPIKPPQGATKPGETPLLELLIREDDISAVIELHGDTDEGDEELREETGGEVIFDAD